MRALFVLFCFLVAGCSDSAGTNADDERVADLDLQASETTGIIRGIVIDEAVRPIVGATITVQGTELVATSNENGAYGFQDLEPGTYFLEAVHVRHGTIQTSTTVVAGEPSPDIVRIQMTTLALAPVYSQVVQQNVFLDLSACGVTCVSCCGFLTNSDTSATYEGVELGTGPGTEFVQFVTVWEYTQSTGETSRSTAWLYDADGTRLATRNIVAVSPIVQDFRDEEALPQAGQLEARGAIWAAGEEGGLVGAVIQQDYEVFIVSTVGFTPPEGYNFYTDGMPALPY